MRNNANNDVANAIKLLHPKTFSVQNVILLLTKQGSKRSVQKPPKSQNASSSRSLVSQNSAHISRNDLSGRLPRQRDLPVLREVLDWSQQLGEPLVVVVERAEERRRLRARLPRGHRRLRRHDRRQHGLGGRRRRRRHRRRRGWPPRRRRRHELPGGVVGAHHEGGMSLGEAGNSKSRIQISGNSAMFTRR